MKKIMIAIGFISLGIGGYILLYRSHDSEIKSAIHNPQSAIQRYVAAEGKVEAMPGSEVEIGSELEEKIAEFFVNEGDWIKKGGLIARLENEDIKARLKEVERELAVTRARLKEVASGSREEEIKRAAAALERAAAEMELAGIDLKRHKQLYKDGVIQRELLDERESALKVAAARVKEAEEEKRLLEKGPKEETLRLHEDMVKQAEASVEYYKRLMDKTFIKSPLSGKVIRKYLEEGEMVNKESNLTAVADVGKIRINAEVDETDIGRVRIGDPVDVTSDAYQGKVFKGEIQEISDYAGIRKVKPNSPAKNLDMKVIQVKINLKDKTPLRLGMTVDIKIMPGN